MNEIDKNFTIPLTEPQRQYFFMEQCKAYIQKKKEEKQRPLFFCTQTFGCQMNARDSEKITGILEEIGMLPSESEESDIVIFNTCTVRENANLKIYGRLGYLKKLKEKNPDMIIILCGCMMQEAEVVEKIQNSYPFVDIIFGTYNIFQLAELLYRCLEHKKEQNKEAKGNRKKKSLSSMVIEIWDQTEQIVEELPSERKYRFKAGVNIMYGCNNFCSYCIVPYVRGREKSRHPDDIIQEIKRLADDGVIEVMLLGQNVNSYGKTLECPLSFAELLQKVEQIPGIERIRFMTSHPKDLSDSLINTIKQSHKICGHLHLPVQSGSTRILQKMNRRYTKEQYLSLTEKIKHAIPEISLTTDIIVGFPGETEADFEETLDVIRKVRYDSAYTFLYSKRTGTPAAQMEEQISEQVAKKRFQRLLQEIQFISEELAKEKEGSLQEVLVEERSEQEKGLLTGRMQNNMLVHFSGEEELIGTLQTVRLKESKGFYYLGERVKK